MTFNELRVALRAQHRAIYLPWQPKPKTGWYVVVCPSEYHPEGWSITVSAPHRIINKAVADSFEDAGFEVQWSETDACMEAWPK